MTLAPEATRPGPTRVPRARTRGESCPIEPVSLATRAMGGRLVVHLDADCRATEAAAAERRVVARIDRWAARLTRHTDVSDLALLNADDRPTVAVRPVLAAALAAGIVAADASEGFADITLLDARLAAESEAPGDVVAASRQSEWQILRGHRGGGIVRRPPGLRFDLGGVGKGWIADRALALLASWPGAVIDADGDLAVLCAPGKHWDVAIDDPRTPDSQLAVLRLAAPSHGFPTRWGVATSGTSVHRWNAGGTVRHHLIDPRTGLPAETDVIQATVIAGSALRAEALSKAAVIAGSVEGFALLERARVQGAVLLTSAGETLALPVTLPLLAH